MSSTIDEDKTAGFSYNQNGTNKEEQSELHVQFLFDGRKIDHISKLPWRMTLTLVCAIEQLHAKGHSPWFVWDMRFGELC